VPALQGTPHSKSREAAFTLGELRLLEEVWLVRRPKGTKLMNPYAMTCFNRQEILIFKAVSWIVDAIPDDYRGHGELVRCHEMARAVHDWVNNQIPGRFGPRPLSLGVVDGHYGVPGSIWVEHSWVETGFGRNILDVYAVGKLPPVQLLDGMFKLPTQQIFQAKKLRGDIMEDVVEELISIFVAADIEQLSSSA
jgi:hypothetical protein